MIIERQVKIKELKIVNVPIEIYIEKPIEKISVKTEDKIIETNLNEEVIVEPERTSLQLRDLKD